jgi:hypothetical protein
MMSMSLVHRAVLVAAIASGATAALAQTPTSPPGRGNRAGGPPSNNELITMLDAYAIVQAQNALDLSDNQYGQFVTRLKRLQDTRRRNVQARNRLLNELRKLTAIEGSTDETAIRDRLKSLRDLDEQAAAALRREYDAVDEVLDARQQARFRLFEERLERQKLDLLFRARERAARPAQRRDGGGR